MIKLLFGTALMLGLASVVWMGSVFVGNDSAALTVTAVIGGVYLIGVFELLRYRRATRGFTDALTAASDGVASLDDFIAKLDPTLQSPVKLRVEGDRVGFPVPVLTPYLIGLLVMLGLLGTFVGMVDTLRGAVSALEGTTELAAVRAGLAAPIKGLGLAFGTSVAGVATSAMLGLMSTLSKRDRILEIRRLDTMTATVFRSFSLVHGQRETFNALQTQAQALPEVASKLTLMAEAMTVFVEMLGSRRRPASLGGSTRTGKAPKTSGSGERLLQIVRGTLRWGGPTPGKPHARGTARPKHCPAGMNHSSERAP